MAELADAQRSERCGLMPVEVQVLSRALLEEEKVETKRVCLNRDFLTVVGDYKTFIYFISLFD